MKDVLHNVVPDPFTTIWEGQDRTFSREIRALFGAPLTDMQLIVLFTFGDGEWGVMVTPVGLFPGVLFKFKTEGEDGFTAIDAHITVTEGTSVSLPKQVEFPEAFPAQRLMDACFQLIERTGGSRSADVGAQKTA